MSHSVLVNGGLLSGLTSLRANWLTTLRAGLYQRETDPVLTRTIDQITPADFAGYTGLVLLAGWSAPTIVGARAATTAAAVVWTHNGGVKSNWIYGMYVIDNAGALVWLQRGDGVVPALLKTGNAYRIVPQFTLRSEYQSWI